MKFRIDLKIFSFIRLFFLTKQIEIYSYIMIFAIIHELGHLLAGVFIGMKPEKIELTPFGLSISFKMKIEEYNKKIKKGNLLEVKKIFVALAGPVTNFIIILISLNLRIDIIKSIMIIYTNFLIMIFNLVPIYPLDGGRILKGVLYINFGKIKSEEYIIKISKIILMSITTISSILILYIHNISIFIIIIYLWHILLQEDIKIKKRIQIYKKILENSMI